MIVNFQIQDYYLQEINNVLIVLPQKFDVSENYVNTKLLPNIASENDIETLLTKIQKHNDELEKLQLLLTIARKQYKAVRLINIDNLPFDEPIKS